MIHIAILDDHQIVVDGLKLLLQGAAGLQVSAEANDAVAMFLLLKNQHIDVLLTDIAVPGKLNGYDLSLLVKKELPHIKVLALSMSEDGNIIQKMIDEAKVDGFISKAAGKEELIKAINEIANGNSYFSNGITEQYEKYQQLKSRNDELHLTAREKEIIACIIKHYSNRQIANELFISERTVETHRKNIYRKTNTKGEACLIQFIQDNKLV